VRHSGGKAPDQRFTNFLRSDPIGIELCQSTLWCRLPLVIECSLGPPQILPGQILIDDTIFLEHCGNLRTPKLTVATVMFLELNSVYHLELIISETLLSDHGSLDLPVINDYTPPSSPEHARLRQGFFARCLEFQGQTGHIFSTTECCQPTCATCSAIGLRD
jgi:hypothetical protein